MKYIFLKAGKAKDVFRSLSKEVYLQTKFGKVIEIPDKLPRNQGGEMTEFRAKVIEWANKQGYTFRLTSEETEELLRLLKQTEGSYWVSLDSEHFRIENNQEE